MSVRRLEHIPGFNIDRVAAAAGEDPDVLRLENLDTDLPPPVEAVDATRAAIGDDDANSWLPFTGRDDLKDAVAAQIERRGGPRYDGRREIVITSGEGEAMLDALFCVTDPGDEVVLTDPTYAGMLNRVRLVGAVPTLVPLRVETRTLATRCRRARGGDHPPDPRGVHQQRLVSHRLGGQRGRVGCDRHDLSPAGSVADLLGRFRGRVVRRRHRSPSRRARRDARPNRSRSVHRCRSSG